MTYAEMLEQIRKARESVHALEAMWPGCTRVAVAAFPKLKPTGDKT